MTSTAGCSPRATGLSTNLCVWTELRNIIQQTNNNNNSDPSTDLCVWRGGRNTLGSETWGMVHARRSYSSYPFDLVLKQPWSHLLLFVYLFSRVHTRHFSRSASDVDCGIA